jgi:UrcA family protein
MSTARTRFHTRIGAGLAALAAVAVTAIGIADGIGPRAQAASSPSVKVTYADLDLSQAAGVQQLYRRLQRASATLCSSLDQAGLVSYSRYERCYNQALQRAVLRINAPQLLALYRSDAAHATNHG